MAEGVYHIPVLHKETIEQLNIRPNTIIADGTLGGGGHTSLILSKNASVKVLGVDRDNEALEYSKKRLSKYIPKRLSLVHSNYMELVNILNEKNLKYVDKEALLIDLASNPGGIDQSIAKELNLKFIWALSLPGRIAPVTSAEFIKNTIYNILDEHMWKII